MAGMAGDLGGGISNFASILSMGLIKTEVKETK